MDDIWSGYIDDDDFEEEYMGLLGFYYLEHPDERIEDCYSYSNNPGSISVLKTADDKIIRFITSWSNDYHEAVDSDIGGLLVLDELFKDNYFHRINCAECRFFGICEKMEEPDPKWPEWFDEMHPEDIEF